MTTGVVAVRNRLRQLHVRLVDVEARIRQDGAVPAIPAFSTWIEQAVAPPPTWISVIMPTRNRASTIRPAIESVIRQSHQNWELLVADDGSEDDTPSVVQGFGDARIRILSAPAAGCASARNRALAIASGDVVTYLDDDNLMGPLWLRSLAWAFERWPAVMCAYGARIIDGGEQVLGMRSSPLPQYHFVPYRRRILELANFIDMNVFAHRRPGIGIQFNEQLAQVADWDFVLRATKREPPLALPVVANLYSTSRQDRLSATGPSQHELRVLHAARRTPSRRSS